MRRGAPPTAHARPVIYSVPRKDPFGLAGRGSLVRGSPPTAWPSPRAPAVPPRPPNGGRSPPGQVSPRRGLSAPPRVAPPAPAEHRQYDHHDQNGCQVHVFHLPPGSSRAGGSVRRTADAPVLACSPRSCPWALCARERPLPSGQVQYQIHRAPLTPQRDLYPVELHSWGWIMRHRRTGWTGGTHPRNRRDSEISEPRTRSPSGVGPRLEPGRVETVPTVEDEPIGEWRRERVAPRPATGQEGYRASERM